MAYIKDLEQWNLLPREITKPLKAVGWLSSEYDFQKGKVPQSFFEKLQDLLKKPWQPFASAGFHTCDLCQYNPPTFKDNLFIPHQGFIFIAPEAITHYIAQHWYKPPDEFIEAIMKCPAMNSMDYKKEILANGGRCLLNSPSGFD